METFGRYELLRRLGHGGMAEVFLARLASGDAAKYLAIKRLLPHFSARPRVVRRLANEARLTVWLTHPNVVQVFDFGRVGEHYFIAMEYVDGCDLRSVIRPRGHSEHGCQLPVEVALDIAYQLADALRYAHRCTDGEGQPLGIIHRDISPHNVLISRDGHPKLADFGVARAAISDDLSRPGALLGKLSYMPPEQANGLPYDARVDLYGCGAVLYEMLAGGRPFGESSRILAASERLPPPPSALRPSLPAALDRLALRAMAPRPEDRFQTAEDLCDALADQLAALGGRPKPHQLAGLVGEALAKQSAARDELEARDVLASPGLAYEPGEDSLIEPEVTAVRHFMILPREAGSGANAPAFVDRPHGAEGAAAAPPRRDEPATEPPTGTYSVPPRLLEAETQPGDSLGARLSPPRRPAATLRDVEPPGAAKTTPWPAGTAAAGRPPSERLETLLKAAIGLLREQWQPALLGAGALVLFALGVLVGRLTAPKALVVRPPPRVAAAPLILAGRVASRQSDAAPPRALRPDAGQRSPVKLARDVDAGAGARDGGQQVERHRPVAPHVARVPARQLSKRQQRWLLEHLRASYRKGDFRVAQHTALRLLRYQPRDQSVLSLLGAASCQLGQVKQARSAGQRLTRARRDMLVTFCRRKGIEI